MRHTAFCWDCDLDFSVKCSNNETVKFCPFCGHPISEDEDMVSEDDPIEIAYDE